ncbi:ABC transporter substrate-binding protein [Rufibacter psychrotolerans]|uniref:ABC transporter substrate-binding protein n=1 Tax=Rufibacter psychrotolerans TaxID=2812556 RepID=UPI001968745A|nr:ABC transporter substrate-binding protein [Rufibacter sp. SYSU D00308]
MKKNCAISLSFFFIWLLSCSSPTQHPSIRVRLAQDPESLHPLSYGNATALQLLNLVYQSLLTVDIKDNSIQPLLAAGLPTVRRDDSSSYFTYQIRPEARWSNGSRVTAADVAFSLKLLHSPLLDNDRWRAQYSFIQNIQLSEDNPAVFTIVCSGYTPEMNLMTGDFFVLPAYQFDPKGVLASVPYSVIRQKFDSLAQTPAFKAYASFINHPALARDTALVKGSGPYQLTSWASGQALVLDKKPGWWAEKATTNRQALYANPSRLVFQVIPDQAAAVLALKARQVDLVDNLPLVAYQEMRKDQQYQAWYNFYSPSSYDLVFLGQNGRHPFLQDKQTRQALAYLVNIPQVINHLQGGLATPTVGLVHPQEKDYYHGKLAPLPYDPGKAKALLAAAGWRQTGSGWQKSIHGKPQTLALELLHRAGNTDFENFALLFQQNARAIGVPITLKAMESSQITDRLQSKEFDLYLRTLVGNPFSYNLIPMLHTSNSAQGGANVTSFGTPETDRLLEQIAREERKAEKGILLKQLQEKMREESNLVFLYFQQNKLAISKQIDSVVVSSLKPGYDLLRFTKQE